MNNTLKKAFAFALFSIITLPVIGADVSERTDCNKIQSRISELAAITEPTEEQSTELSQLQAQYRSNCSKTASGRRTSGRDSTITATATTNQIATPVVETVVMTSQTVLSDYIGKRESLCEELKNNMDVLKNNGATEIELKPLQNQHDKDCSDIDKSAVVEVDAETAAANVAAGLCTDGSKPNQFGCCEGETFKDMGNLVFACCPDDGGECYPPINTGDSL